ncbi:MAG: type II secretion system protein GspL [Blastomonas fulva]|uniref:type II secretion system protein GspL n=1 Tax=Blastomonas fulva TaxID=1550728 RepID=UPI0040341D40
MALDGLIVTCPLSADAALHWWRAEDGHIVARGQDFSPPSAAPGTDRGLTLALIPAADTVIRILDMGEMSAAQAEAAARYRAADLSIGGDLFVGVRALGNGGGGMQVLCATISRARLADHLAELALRGLDPDVLVPVGLLLPATDAPVSAVFGDLGAERLGDVVLPPDDALGALLLGETPALALDQDARHTAMLAALADPPLNLRQGDFARRTPMFALGPGQGRTLAWLLGALLLVSLAIPLIEIGKNYLGADLAERRALASAQRLVPGATDVAQAEQQLDGKLAARGAGNAIATVPLAGLLSAMQPVAGVTIRQADYRPGGVIGAMIAAPRVEDLNAVLIALQNNGYTVTAANRSDATGQAVADITVLAP